MDEALAPLIKRDHVRVAEKSDARAVFNQLDTRNNLDFGDAMI